jgi:hypothetical protein
MRPLRPGLAFKVIGRIIAPLQKGNRYNMLRKIWLVILLGATLGLGLAGCERQGEPAAAEPDLERLEQRVRERWQAKIARDFDRVWEYSTPNYRRSFPKELYSRQFSYALDWELTSIEVLNYDADAAVASVAVGVMSIPTKQTSTASRLIGTTSETIREQWFFIDGEWWHSTSK